MVPNKGKMSWRLEKKKLWNLPEKLLKIHISFTFTFTSFPQEEKTGCSVIKTSEMQDLDLTFERNFWQ